MPKKHSVPFQSSLLRILVSIALLAVAVWALYGHWSVVWQGLLVARHARIGWLILTGMLSASTFLIAAATYGVLAMHRLRYRNTLLVELSSAFVNRLLPSGLGGLGLHGVYLFNRKHTVAEATVVVSVNNFIGLLAHLGLLLVVLVFSTDAIAELFAVHRISIGWPAAWVGAVLMVCILLVPAVRRRVARFGRNLFVSLRKVTGWQLTRAYLLATVLTVTYTLVLFCSAHAVGISLGIVQIFVVFSAGMLAGTITPTPGGLVGTEAGLYAAFVAYGVSPASAAAAVVLFRLATYWLPLLPGLLALAVARRTRIV